MPEESISLGKRGRSQHGGISDSECWNGRRQVVNAVPSADLPPILIALRPMARIVGANGERVVEPETFLQVPGQTVLGRGKILAIALEPLGNC